MDSGEIWEKNFSPTSLKCRYLTEHAVPGMQSLKPATVLRTILISIHGAFEESGAVFSAVCSNALLDIIAQLEMLPTVPFHWDRYVVQVLYRKTW